MHPSPFNQLYPQLVP
jgi:hypothetical protein